MAYFFPEPSRTFSEYLLVPGYSSSECIPANVSLKTPVVKYRRGEEPALTMNVPMVSAVMQAVSGERMGIALAKEGGIAFIYVSQPIAEQAEMVRRVKNYKAGFVTSDSNLRIGDTLADVLALKERTGHSTMAVTDDGTGTGRLLGLVTSRDYRVSRMDPATPVKDFMTPVEKVISAVEGTSLKTANDIIWDHKLNALPILTEDGRLVSFVFRKDYDSHKDNPLELLDGQKRYVVGAGINTRDYEERVPALVDAGVDVLVIDSSEGYSEWQARTLKWIRDRYGDSVKVGAGNVVDGEGFRFLAEARNMAMFNTHPNIVNVYEFFEENNTAYIAMEFLKGMSFKQYIAAQGGKIGWQTAVSVVLSVLDGLKEIHRAKIIHRDVSPDNIFLVPTDDGKDYRIKLIDFGAARFASGEEEKTLSIILKPGYAPPEQYRSKSRQGPWTDLYAVGAVLYRAIT